MRLFIAINIEPATRSALSLAIEPLRGIFPDARWVAEDLLHMTVKFLGERDQAFAGRLATALDNIAGKYKAIPYTVGGIDAFPNLRRPSVVWTGVHSDPKLELVNHDVESACIAMGVPLDGRPFRPHITLARIRHAEAPALRAFAEMKEKIHFEQKGNVASLDLMLSEQRQGQLQYTVLHAAPLGEQ